MDNASEIMSLLGPSGFVGRLSTSSILPKLQVQSEETRDQIHADVVARTPHEFGALQDAIRVSLEQMLDRPGFSMATSIDLDVAPYGYFVNRGTGIFGPMGQPYTSIGDGWMSFFWRRYGTRSVAGPPLGSVNEHMRVQSVRGQPAQEFLQDGWKAAVEEISPSFWDRVLARI